MSENDAGIEINVEVPEITETPTPPTEPVVTVVEAGSDGATAPLADATIDHEGRLVRIETLLETLVAEIAESRAAAADAQFTADIAMEETAVVREEIQEVAEEQQPDPSEDEEPAREHPFYRSRKLFGKAD